MQKYVNTLFNESIKNFENMNIDFDYRFLKFRSPFTGLIAGPQASGKTTFVRKIIENYRTVKDISDKVINVLWVFGVWQTLYEVTLQNANIKYATTLPTIDEIESLRPHLLVVDDLMTELKNDVYLTQLLTKYSHHKSINVLFLVQNLFYKSSILRDISLNASYIVVFPNKRDKRQIYYLANQLFPENRKYFLEAYRDATKELYGSLLIDLKPDTPEELMLRGNIFDSPVVYLPK